MYTLETIDSEDIEDVLKKIETSFHIEFKDGELAHVQTFGELCDSITEKIKGTSIDDCTTQQAFYKLRKAFDTIGIKNITPNTKLQAILPKRIRKKTINTLAHKLDIDIQILTPPAFITVTLFMVFIIGFITIFFNIYIGISFLIVAVIGFWISNKLSNTLTINTIAELTQKLTRENYIDLRTVTNTYNPKEIEFFILDLFSNELGLLKSKLHRNAKINRHHT